MSDTRPTILVVDDERRLNQLIATNLMLEGYRVYSCYCGAEALSEMARIRPDLVILDIMMPDVDGLEVLRQIRLSSNVAVIMLTARSRTEEKVKGLQFGADDYLAKPFSFSELLARIAAILRRASSGSEHLPVEKTIASATVLCDLSKHQVTVQGTPVPLANLEFKLLSEFMRAEGRVLTHDYLISVAWPSNEGDITTLRVAVGKLRTRLKAISGRDYIETIHKLGYKFSDPE